MRNPGNYIILVVDDDVFMIKTIMNMLLKNPDYNILTTGNGKSACEIAIEKSPDLIIMDWQMPEMNGLDATMQIKQNELTKDIPIIISTGVMIESTNLSLAMLAGAVDFIRKPIDEVELIARVSNMLRLSEAYLNIEQQNVLLQNQLTSKLINIQQLNELKSTAIKLLNFIKEQTSTSDNKQLVEAVLKTERLFYSKVYQIKWEDFESHFESVYHGFYRKIRTKHGDLTTNELRLCSFVKLKLSNKEISTITYTSADSVNTARKRLKKKLDLLPTDSLQLYINNI
jgi:CheY-like chemotaxis protein/DNA-binding CsgD family transcriptional regulator